MKKIASACSAIAARTPGCPSIWISILELSRAGIGAAALKLSGRINAGAISDGESSVQQVGRDNRAFETDRGKVQGLKTGVIPGS